jgi:hypothetical protein
MVAYLSDHVAALLKSDTDPYAESLATIFLDSSLVYAGHDDAPRAWGFINEAIKTLCGGTLDPCYLPMKVALVPPSASIAAAKDVLYIVLDQGLHVCPWTRIHIILAAAAPWDGTTKPGGNFRIPKRMRNLIVSNGATACESVVPEYCLLLRERACSQMGDCLETLLKHLPLVPRRPGSSPWAVAIFAKHCMSNSVVGPIAQSMIGPSPVC